MYSNHIPLLRSTALPLLIAAGLLVACASSNPSGPTEPEAPSVPEPDTASLPEGDATLAPSVDASSYPDADAHSPPEPDASITPEQDASPSPSTCAVKDVFERNGCFACHGANADLNGGGLHLTLDRLEESVVGVASRSPGCAEHSLVDVENPDASILLHTLASDRYADAVDEACRPMPMPLGGIGSLSEDDVDCVERWIRTLEPPEAERPDVTFPAPAITVLTRVKYLIDGGALSGEELERASGPDGDLIQDGFEALIAAWMDGDRFRAKRRQFLELHLQQTPSDINYFNQFRNTRTNSLAPVRESLNQSLIRTAERIIDDGEDFRSIVTTNTWEVTTLTLLALKMADNPMLLRPNGVWPKNNGINDIRFVLNQPDLYDRGPDGEDWRTVTLVHNPDSTDMVTEAEILDPANAARLRSIPDGGSLELRAPRLGFFTSPAFFQTWQTNRDNDFRVTVNQAMIVATGLTFSPGDNTPLVGDDAAVDLDMFPRDSTCYGCHKNLDVMRTAFQANYDNINTRHTVPEAPLPRPGFSFQGRSTEIESLLDWANALANHPNFATAWVLKLCQWASSSECSPSNVHVLALSRQFAESGHDMTQLFMNFFASPLMTMTSDRLDTAAPGAQVSVARLGHYCHAMRARLKDIRSAQGVNNRLPDRLDICNADGPAEIVSASLPKDQFARGSSSLHQPRDYTPMVSVAFEGLCAVSAANVVDDHGRAALNPQDPTLALTLMNTHLLGFPEGTARHVRTQGMLQRYFNALTASPACESPAAFRDSLSSEDPECGLELNTVDALRDLWTMVCQSPSLTGIGP